MQISIVSGKGGTGKTTLATRFFLSGEGSTLLDCDVDAPDLHILLNPREVSREDVIGLNKARINESLCIDWGHCRAYCRSNAVIDNPSGDRPFIRECRCEGCRVCTWVCPVDAIAMEPAVEGSLSQSTASFGPIVHARLMPEEETSGKLVYTVREQSRVLAREQNAEYILIDGSPGIGCSVISSLTNTQQAVIVTEPSMSAYHDLIRVCELVENLSIPVVFKLPFNLKMIEAISNRKIPSVVLPEFFREHGFEEFIGSLVSES